MPTDPSTTASDHESTAELLAEMTGRDPEEFEAEGYEHPSLDELELVTDGGTDSTGIELSDRQRERFEQVREECDDPSVPEPTDEQVMKGLLDTWDAVNDGHYSGIDREEVSVSADDGDAVIGVCGAEIRLTIRTDGRKRSVELDHHGEGPYWLIVGEDEDGNEGILGEMEPVFDPAEAGDLDE
jgi:hypothetical protein